MENNALLTDFSRCLVEKENDAKLTPDEFRRLQFTELSLIKEFDRVCRANGIRYTIFCGTLLGAVRHKGYIPWDDDADIGMLREDYEKFKKVAGQMDQSVCFFQDHETDPEYLWGYGKLRKPGTTHIRTGQEHIKCQDGIYVDVFPLDDIPMNVPGQLWQNFICFVNRKILWANVGKVSDKGIKKLWWKFLSLTSKDTVYKRMKRYESRSNNDSPNMVRCLLFPSFGTLYVKNPINKRYGMEKSWFLNVRDYEFEGCSFLGMEDADAFLKHMYNDYMTLPPPEKRVPKVSFKLIKF
ncbi:MAG: LicD family protein [Clostridiales bacterium]|nr:LicD family protein [Clostridiales bacterium]